MAHGVFICYRREDAPGHSGRLADRLSQRFGDDEVFMDVDSIPIGVDFVAALTHAVESSHVVLVIIGPRWLDARERLDDPNDYVRVEIQAALERDMPVVPVLVHGARLPSAQELPEPLQPLVRRHAVELTDANFRSDSGRLIEGLEPILEPHAAATPPVQSGDMPWSVVSRSIGRRVFTFDVTLTDSSHRLDVEFRDTRSNLVRLDGAELPITENRLTKERWEFPVTDGPVTRNAVLTLELGMLAPKAIQIELDGHTLFHGLPS
jgi:hypothetical protein